MDPSAELCGDRFSFVSEFAGINFGDKRLNRRFQIGMEKFNSHPNPSIRSTFVNWSATMGFYRLLENERVTKEKIQREHSSSCLPRLKAQQRILTIQDTTSLSMTSHGALEGVGSISQGARANNSKGIFVHPTVAYTSEGVPLGVLHSTIWSRAELDPKNDLFYSEHAKWSMSIQATAEAKAALPEVEFINVADRECCSAELMLQALEGKISFVYRSRSSRIDNQDGKKVLDKLRASQSLGKVVLNIPATSDRPSSKQPAKKGTPQRQAHLQVYSAAFDLVVERSKLRNEGLAALKPRLQAVLITEPNPPAGISPVEWFIITDLPAESFEQALDIINIYKTRWKIETFFKILKSGCRVENCMVQTVEKLSKMTLLLMLVTWRLQYLQEVISHQSRVATQQRPFFYFSDTLRSK